MNGRVRAGILLLLIGAGVSAGRQLAQIAATAAPQERDAEIVADYDEHRFTGLSDALPPGAVVGYLTSNLHNTNPDRSHILAQYVLAPSLIVWGVEQPLVLVDLGPDEETPPALAGRPLLARFVQRRSTVWGRGSAMIGTLLGLAPPWLAAYLAVRWIVLPPTPWRTLFRAALATGLAIGLSSLTFFLWAVCAGPQQPGLPLAELIVFGGMILLLRRAEGGSAANSRRRQGTELPLLAPQAGLKWALAFVLLCAVGIVGWYLWHSPHGDWDAWAIWNLRARFLARGERWTAAFSPLLFWSHPDYPLLLPGAVARCWLYAGQETTAVPCLIACLFGAATVALLMAALALLRSPTQGCLAALVLLATPYFLELMTAQYADVPLAFFILASAALFEIHDDGGGIPPALLVGVFIGLAAWTKNEGLLVLAVAGVIRIVLAVRRPSRAMRAHLAAVTLGLLPIVAILLYFKLRFAPRNDLIAGQGSQATLARLTDARRYGLVAGYFLAAILKIGPGAVVLLACYRALLGRPNRPRGFRTLVFLVLMLLGYAVVYLTTPSELSVHLRYSIDRLLMQLWPTALLAFFLLTAAPEEAAQRAA